MNHSKQPLPEQVVLTEARDWLQGAQDRLEGLLLSMLENTGGESRRPLTEEEQRVFDAVFKARQLLTSLKD